MEIKFLIVNSLTLLRILGAIYIFFKHLDSFTDVVILFIIFMTDFFDGYLARKFNSTSKFGKEFDQVTDKFVFYLLYYKLIIHGLGSIYLLILIILRDLLINYYRFKNIYTQYTKTENTNKFKTALQFFLIILGYIFIIYNLKNTFILDFIAISTVILSLIPVYKIITYEFKKMDW